MEKALYAAVVVIAWIAKESVTYFIQRAKKGGNGTHRSGDKDPAYWQQEFRAAVLEVNKLQITPWLEKLTEAHEEVVRLLQERSSVFTRQTDLLQELVDANRRKRR